MSEHFVEAMLGAAAGSVVTVTPDWIVVNDGVSYLAAQEAASVAEPEKVLVYFDHNVPTGDPEGARIFGILRRFAKANGCKFIQAQGTAYQHMLNATVRQGQIVIGGGTHSAIFGAVGALGINISPLELARVLETGKYQAIVPPTVTVAVTGALPAGVSMMDAALGFLAANKGLEGRAIEFAAPQLSAHDKGVLCSMACETGAFTAVCTGEGEGGLVLDLSAAVPMAVKPCAVRAAQPKAEIVPLASLKGLAVTAGQIGGYTGGTIEDLRTAAKGIEGKKLARGFRLTVCPATSADYIAAMEEGIITAFIDYGAQISAAGDHSVVTQGAGVIGKNETLLTTGLYTYSGCMGVADSSVYTASVESIIAASYMRTV